MIPPFNPRDLYTAPPKSAALVRAMETFRRVNAMWLEIEDFVLVTGQDVPPMNVCSPEWYRVEDEIQQALNVGDLGEVKRLCESYELRSRSFFDKWKSRLEGK